MIVVVRLKYIGVFIQILSSEEFSSFID